MNIKRKCQVVMLPTNEQKKDGMICKDITEYDKIIAIKINNFMEHEDYVGQHLYITSDEEMKKGDYVYVACSEVNVYEIRQITEYYNGQFLFDDESQIDMDYCKKIIATTDTSLISINEQYFDVNKSRKSAVLEQKTLPQPPQEFIRQYIEEYNKGNVITDVLVEYENEVDSNPNTGYDYIGIKVKPDNTITIKKVKDSWSREEVIEVINKFSCENCDDAYRNNDKWIEENL